LFILSVITEWTAIPMWCIMYDLWRHYHLLHAYLATAEITRKSSIQNTITLFGGNCFLCLVLPWVGG